MKLPHGPAAPRKPRTFAERLEHRAERVLERGSPSSSPVLSALENELALALEQVRQAREVHEHARQDLLEIQRYVEADILRWTLRPGVTYPDRYREIREPLRARLLRLRAEGRWLSLTEAAQLRPLEERLLMLLTRHRQLARLYEHRNHRA